MPSRAERGFTLVELLIVLAILGVLFGLALPALGEAVARYQLRSTRDALLASLHNARTTAIRHHLTVDLCPSRDGHTCALMEDWSFGWVGRERASGVAFDLSGPIHPRIAAARGIHRGKVAFQDTGTSGGMNQYITLCLRGKAGTALSLVISNTGRTRREQPRKEDAEACAKASAQKKH